MKLRNSMIVLGIICSASGFASCIDESDYIVPQPVNIEEPAATIGNETEDHDPM